MTDSPGSAARADTVAWVSCLLADVYVARLEGLDGDAGDHGIREHEKQCDGRGPERGIDACGFGLLERLRPGGVLDGDRISINRLRGFNLATVYAHQDAVLAGGCGHITLPPNGERVALFGRHGSWEQKQQRQCEVE